MQGIKIDFIAKTIIITKAFKEAASEIDSEEYSQLQRAQKENPDMKVVLKTKNSSHHKSDYKGLTYDYMTRFIRIMDRENLLTFQDVIAHYEDFGYDSSKVYQHVKDWFLETYPHHKDMIVDSTPQRISPKAVA